MNEKPERLGPGHAMFQPINAMLAERTNNMALHGFVKANICSELSKRLRIGRDEGWKQLMTMWDAGKVSDELVVSVFEPAWQKALYECTSAALVVGERPA